MSAALTFGSVGDIIALCGLAVELSRVFHSTRGSATEYQFMCKDLDQFVQVLMQVIGTYQQFQASPWLDGLAMVTRSIVEETGKLLREVLDSVRDKYKDSLQQGGSGSMVKDMFVAKHDDLKALAEAVSRLELQHQAEKQERDFDKLDHRQQLASFADQLKSRDLDNRGVLDRIENDLTQQSSSSSTQLTRIEDHLMQQSSGRPHIIDSLTGVFSVVSDIKQKLLGIADTVASLHIVASSRWFLQGPSESMIWFEDPFGRVDPFPLNWIHSWDGLQTIMELRFKDSTGYDMVRRKEYILEDDCNGRVIDQKKPFKDAFRVRKKVNMNMVFRRRSMAVRTLLCPRCDLPAAVPDGNRVKCARETCKMWFGLIDLAAPRRQANQSAETDSADHPRAGDFERVRFILEALIDRVDRVQVYKEPKLRLIVIKFWTCSNCGNSPMVVELYASCFNCGHPRCDACANWNHMSHNH